jgi:hypothetical protein
MKKCTKCLEFKTFDMFQKHKYTKDKLASWCTDCKNIQSYEIARTKEGVIKTIYFSQKRSSKRRNHRMPEYSLQELLEWCFSQTKFHELYNEWANSGFLKMLKPSIDRKYDDIHYCFKNIQLMTWQENKDKQTKCFIDNTLANAGYFGGGHREVEAINEDGSVFKHFISLAQAKRFFNLKTHSNIVMCCQGKKNKCAGYKWRYCR